MILRTSSMRAISNSVMIGVFLTLWDVWIRSLVQKLHRNNFKVSVLKAHTLYESWLFFVSIKHIRSVEWQLNYVPLHPGSLLFNL